MRASGAAPCPRCGELTEGVGWKHADGGRLCLRCYEKATDDSNQAPLGRPKTPDRPAEKGASELGTRTAYKRPSPSPSPRPGSSEPRLTSGALPELPASASPDMRAIAEDFEQLLRERLATGDSRPVPYALGYAAGRLGWRARDGRADKMRARRTLARLVRDGVLIECEPLEPRGQPYGTKTYLPSAWGQAGKC
jgi:hypothetical protein